jgi:hypothetical protein
MKVIVVVQPDGNDIKFRIVVPGRMMYACSPVMTIEGKADLWNGNPYGVYGDAIEDYVGCDKYDVSISVARCRSGEL